MTDRFIEPRSKVTGEIRVPGDKSISHRAVILSSLARGDTEIHGCLLGEDCRATINAFRAMGVRIGIDEKDGRVSIEGAGAEGLAEPEDVLDMGNSGTSARLLTGLLAGREFFSVLTGDASLRRRPMKRVAEPLSLMGAEIHGRGGGAKLPLAIRGKRLSAISYKSPLASAQVKSAILLAGLDAVGVTEVEEPRLSRDHTERMLTSFGVQVKRDGTKASLEGGEILRSPGEIFVPADISSAAFFIAAALLAREGELRLPGVGLNPTRDGVVEIFQKMGGKIEVRERCEAAGEPVADLIVKPSKLKGVRIGADLVPRAIDEFPIVFAAAALAEGTTVVRGAKELRVKESDRIAVMAEVLTAVGARCEELEDGMIIHGSGGKPLPGGEAQSRGDHRVAMTLAVLALSTEKGVNVRDVDCVKTSFPGFFDLLGEVAGGSVELSRPPTNR